ncbi:hypothetical protein HanXRQr2_Chr13g0567441 [Helianthus annuus]|uniref:Uncharacterized protein n=1 Tax=Helianthus annuus TaxID=4232 RepID=A0A9K3H8J7_HELAN|nr:hypothetical protein HanXRQr2_Chr13g0567441 [Helianthus annuus]
MFDVEGTSLTVYRILEDDLISDKSAHPPRLRSRRSHFELK